ncbi:SigE family RNA polymerase sigma factor [Nocardioides lianchengensis]|uniref:RNA polymerase sigma-70 factor, sigma-E family n=1 Tax=Nocardioides lianchengensis TaxID=1045774 RepID=A0A1G6V9R9_9ACTN|nr:SigE family RNA polymerase sigma factor [Nocardioides lianchengensis]NYG11172.1 RNA polymerase sigma-70 factor (sigma-E family) [Nocardioides lianchengensis]SDD49585.1 RNA polymerase sigma-70 factor, sigma-E family [Nocardioides lianchengensis]
MQRGDRDAEFTEFYGARVAALRRVAYVVTRDWYAAEDVTQRAFVKVYRAWPRIRPDGLEAYVRRAVVNEALSWTTRRPRDVVAEHLPERAVVEPETPLDLEAALATLPAQQRAVVALRFVDDRSVAETAVALGLAEGTVKSHTAKAIATLRRHLPTLTEPWSP